MDTHNFRVSKKHKIVVIQYSAKVEKILSTAKVVTRYSKKFLFVPHRNDETKVLNNLGYNIPAPISCYYSWQNTTPFDSQKATAKLLTLSRRGYVLNAMGTGKTRAALFACDYLMANRDISGVLIIAPLSTITTVWERELFTTFPERTCCTLYGSKNKRLRLLSIASDFYVINHDGVNVIGDELQNNTHIDTVIIDELAVFRNARTERWRMLNKICKNKKNVWGMTGSPTPNAPTDAYAQAKLITPESIPRSFRRFRADTMYQVSQFKWLPRKNANDVVYNALQPAVRYTLDECTDIPEVTYSTREVMLTKEQQKAYKDMYSQLEVELATHPMQGKVTAANAGVQLFKLIQISGGFIYGPDGVVDTYDHKPRLHELSNIIDSSEKKVIVFTPYRHSVNTLFKFLSKKYDTAAIHGGIPKNKRDKIFAYFQHANRFRILIAHPGTMAHGLTLTAANTIVWFLPPPSLEVYEQANARTPRPGQTHKTHIIHIQATPIETHVYKTIERRGNVQRELLSMFQNVRESMI